MSFNWVPFFREVAEKLLQFENRQDELLALLRDLKSEGFSVVPLEDDQPGGGRAPLTVMDPFTFMANFSRLGDSKTIRLCEKIGAVWNIQAAVPDSFEGRANTLPHNSWFFTSTRIGREVSAVSALWKLAHQALHGAVSDLEADLFDQCLHSANMGLGKLALGLSWLNPAEFLPVSRPILRYLKSQGFTIESRTLTRGGLNSYSELLKTAKEICDDLVQFNHDAWQWDKANPVTPGVPEVESGEIDPDLLEEMSEDEPIRLLRHALNTILYGPPGTGKTFNAIPHALQIIDGHVPDDRKAIQQRFDTLRRNGRIGFVTFHQSFSYEEFVEGLRPVLNTQGGEVRYEVRDGILKETALRAQTVATSSPSQSGFEAAWKKLRLLVESGQLKHLEGRSSGSLHELSFEGEKLYGSNIKSTRENRHFYTTKTTQRLAWEKLPLGVEVNSTPFVELGSESKGHSAFAAVIHNKLIELSETELDFTTAPRYVLIIDEINRGNISRILGELITLLEEDKRLGADNELRVTLPISQETFALPPNLYLLGTMNTADKSLALLDIALRRRFSFKEIRPDFDLDALKLSPEMREILKALNLRLEYALDREHCIGHAYFMGVSAPEQFDRVFRDKIIPLLQEFFYNDWETLRGVLGESGSGGGFIRALDAPPGLKGRTAWRWWFDVDPHEPFSCFEQLAKNYGIGLLAALEDGE